MRDSRLPFLNLVVFFYYTSPYGCQRAVSFDDVFPET